MQNTNILLITTDQHRFDALSCYGLKEVATPNLDRLASEGALFENCYVNNPVCTPSRASILTGKPITGHGVYKLHDIFPESEVTIAKRLKSVGYKTALFGKLHISGRVYELENRHPNDGFDIYEESKAPYNLSGSLNGYAKWLNENHEEFYHKLNEEKRGIGNIPEEVHLTRWITDNTIDFLKEKDEKPFFCFMSIFDPHDPYSDYPKTMLDEIDTDNISPPDLTAGETKDKPDGIKREHEHSYLGNFDDYSSEDIKSMRIGYFASIAFLDKEIGRVLKTLEEQGLKDNTLVIFTSDHGDMLGDHELLAKGAFFYDPCTKVPMIIRFPGHLQNDIRISELVQPHDVAATVLSQAGYTKQTLDEIMPESQDLIALANHEVNPRQYAVCQYRNTSICDKKLYWDPPINATMYRQGRYKISVYHDIYQNKAMEGELYDMIDDPKENNNLWNDSEFALIKTELLEKMINSLVLSDILYHGSRGGEAFPEKSQWSKNNPL